MSKRILDLILKNDANKISNEIIADYPNTYEKALHDIDLIRHENDPYIAGNDHHC